MNYDEFNQALSAMDPAEVAIGASAATAVAFVMIICSILWFFISAIGFYKMFAKAGVAGWKAFIPYYRSYILFNLSWNTKLFWPFLVAQLLVHFLKGEAVAVNIILLVAAIVLFVLGIKLYIRVAKSFGKGKGMGVLLFFLSFIGSMILGFGKAQYIGNTTVAEEA